MHTPNRMNRAQGTRPTAAKRCRKPESRFAVDAAASMSGLRRTSVTSRVPTAAKVTTMNQNAPRQPVRSANSPPSAWPAMTPKICPIRKYASTGWRRS